MFGIGGFELFIILIFAFLIFGPDKLPEIAKMVGKGIAKFRNAQESMTEQLKDTPFMDKESGDLVKNPIDILNGMAASSEKSKSSPSKQHEAGAQDRANSSEKPEGPKANGGEGDEEKSSTMRSESFAERKARYDRERAKRKQEEVKAAEEAERKASEEAAAKKEAEENPKIEISSKTVSEEGE